MDFQRHPSTSANSLFPTHQRQANINVGGGNAGSLAFPLLSVPTGSLQDTAKYMPWSHNAVDDPYGLIRKPFDYIDCEGETDLQGLVSNILDESDPQESHNTIGSLSSCNSIWSPKTLKEELLQYSHSETKAKHSTNFPANNVSRETSSKAEGQSSVEDVEEFCLPSRGLATSPHWIFNLVNGDKDSFTIRPPNLPPGLSVPSKANTYVSQIYQSNNDYFLAGRKNIQPFNDFPEPTDVFKPYCEMNGPCFDPQYKGNYSQSSTKATTTEECIPNDINQLVNSFHSFMAGEPDSFSNAEFPNIHNQMVDIHHEDSNSSSSSTQTTPVLQIQRQVGREFGIVQKERNGRAGKQNLSCDDFQFLSDIGQQHTDFYQQPKPFPQYLNHPYQYQTNISMQRENCNMKTSQYSKNDLKHGQMKKMIKPQLQKDSKMMHMSGFLEEGITARPLCNTPTRQREIKKAYVQNQYFDIQGSMQSQRFEREHSSANLWNTQQFMPIMNPVNSPRRLYSFPSNSDVCTRGPLLCERGVPTETISTATIVCDLLTNGGGLQTKLNSLQDACYEQWRCLQKERKRVEVILSKTFPGKWPEAVNNTTYPETPPNPTELDVLLAKQIGENKKVEILLEQMESMCNVPFPMNIHTTLKSHHTAICITEARCKGEITNMSKQQQPKNNFTDNRDTLILLCELKNLTAATKNVCTALWCALQMTLPKPIRSHYHNYEYVTCSEACSSPFDGYSFRL